MDEVNHSGSGAVKVAGVDGCIAGWVVVTALVEAGERLSLGEVFVVADFEARLAATGDCAAVAVDVPIGLSDDGQRLADFAARRLIGPRRSSVFPPPARPLVDMADDYAALNAASKAIRAGISRQTFNILGKIRDADGCMTPELQDRVTESHPEVSFWALKQAHLPWNKRHRDGRADRISLLESVYGVDVAQLKPPRGAAWDDLYDAAVLAWTAMRVANGTARRLPEEPQRDAQGLRMEIVY
jgi:predicted RNase H-like nuclease